MSEYVTVWVDDLPDLKHGEEIVRCKDCKNAHEVTWPACCDTPHDYLDCCGELVETWDYYYDEPKKNPVKPDGFCAWGERREKVEQ